MEQLDLVNEMDPRSSDYFLVQTEVVSPTKFWKLFTSKLRNKDQVGFAIDGLEDTNPIYRINSEWDSIMNGLKIVFKENWCQCNLEIYCIHNSQRYLKHTIKVLN